MDEPLRRVFEPIMVGGVEIPNRIVAAPHATMFSSPPALLGGDDFVAYHVARAKGGIGLSIFEAMAVHPSSQAMTVSSDETIPRYREIVRALRPHGTRVFQQLFHIGHLNATTFGGGVPWSVSTQTSLAGVVGTPVTTAQIDEVVEAFGAAARRCREGGIDGVEVHASHGTLPFSFLSPLTNTRTDGYNGDLANRMRFLQEILRAMRRSAGDDFVVGVRLGASEMPGSVNEPELRLVIEELEREGLIDFLTTSYGDFYRPVTITGGMECPPGYQLPSSSQLADAATVPTMLTGRIRTLQEAEQILASGDGELISLTRALIADPDLVRKSRAGRVAEVRPCIGCNQGCMAAILNSPPRMACTVNPVVGFEATLDEHLVTPTAEPRRVLVVGGGPAGMEAARVAADGGHRVTLVEAEDELGGALRAGRRAPRYGELGSLVDWLTGAVERAGVEVRLSTRMTADDVEREGADVVIVATGSVPRMDGVQPAQPIAPARGVDLPHVRSSVDLLTGGVPEGARSALVVDTVGHFEAVAVAEALVDRGVAVTFVTSLASFGGPPVQATFREASALEFLHRGDFAVLARHHVDEITPTACHVRPMYSARTHEVPADIVVLVTQNEPQRTVYDELVAAGRPDVFLVGDAASPRDLTRAMAEAHRAARAIPDRRTSPSPVDPRLRVTHEVAPAAAEVSP